MRSSAGDSINATMQQVSYLTYRFLGEDAYNASKEGDPSRPIPGYAPVIRQIAYDGIQLAPERYNDPNFGLSQEFAIAPANRIDLLVQAPATTGKSRLAFRALHGKPPAGCAQLTQADFLSASECFRFTRKPSDEFSDGGKLPGHADVAEVG